MDASQLTRSGRLMLHFWSEMTPSLPPQGSPCHTHRSILLTGVIGNQAWYFTHLEPCDCHAAHDTRRQALRIARFYTVAGVELCRSDQAFDVLHEGVYRKTKLLKARGETVLGASQRPRRREGDLLGDGATLQNRLT